MQVHGHHSVREATEICIAEEKVANAGLQVSNLLMEVAYKNISFFFFVIYIKSIHSVFWYQDDLKLYQILHEN